MSWRLILHLTILNDDVGGERPKANDEVAEVEQNILQRLYSSWTYLNANKILFLNAKVMLYLCKYLQIVKIYISMYAAYINLYIFVQS